MPENSISSSPCWTGAKKRLEYLRTHDLEQLRQKQRRLPGAIGIACAVVALLVCGPDHLVIPSMVLIFASLLIGRKKLCA